MVRSSCSAILFDLDGVLVESRGSVERQWTRWAREKGLEPDTVIHFAHGRPTIETIRKFQPQADADAELEIIEEREIEDRDLVHAIPGAAELLARIPVGRWTIVTSGTRPLAESRLKYVGLPAPAKMITASDIKRGKPDPEPYLKGASALQVEPKDCIVIEDAPSGIRAGKAAGMRVIAVPTTYSRAEIAEADWVVERLADVSVQVADGRIEIGFPTHSMK